MIPGMCRLWMRPKPTPQSRPFWTEAPNRPGGYTEMEDLQDVYEEKFPGLYEFRITADSYLCKPLTLVTSGVAA